MRLTWGVAILPFTLLLLACSNQAELDPSPEPFGDFKLGYAVVSAKGSDVAPGSREVTAEELEAPLQEAIERRLDRYSGGKFYHVTVTVGGYFISPGGIPVVASPKSAWVLRVSVWDDAAGTKLDSSPHILPISEPLSAETAIGSGLTRTKHEQIKALSERSAQVIENWLRSDNGPILSDAEEL